jgi:hypothetical protein
VSRPRQHAKLTVHVSLAFKAEIAALAQSRGLTESGLCLALLEEALRQDTEHAHGALIQAGVERAVHRAIATQLGRVGDLSFRAALHSDELRRLMRPVLTQLLGQDTARTARREAHSAAWQQLREPLAAPPDQEGGTWPDAPTPS